MNLTHELLNRWLSKILSVLSEPRRRKLEEFVQEMRISGFSPWSIKANVQAVLTLGRDGKPYEELTREDLIAWMDSLSSKEYRPESVSTYRRRVKRFLRWVHGCRSPRDPTPEPVSVIKVPKVRRELPEGVLSYGDVQRLVVGARNPRDRALIHVGYESGCRAGELLGLRIRDVEFDQYGAVIVVNGKTGMRRIRLVESVHDLQIWMNSHPNRENPSAWLWPGSNGEAITVEYFNKILKRAARRAGLSKRRIYPHLLRHTRATHLAKVLTEDQLRTYFGWTKTSQVPARYVHLSGRDVDDALLKHYGIDTGRDRKVCPRCGCANPKDAVYCVRCSAVLSPSEAFRIEERRTKEEEIVARVVRKLLELAPDIVERALQESGALEEMAQISEEASGQVVGGPAGGI